MNTATITWSAHEHAPNKKTPDWYWVLGIISASAAIAALVFGQYIVALMILMAGVTLGLLGKSEARHYDFALTDRGIEVDDQLFLYENLVSFNLFEREHNPHLLVVESSTILTPHLFIPLDETVEPESIREFLRIYLPEVSNGIPLSHQITEFFGL